MIIVNPEQVFKKEAKIDLPDNIRDSGTITWQCPSNIALVKYWGKKPGQLPNNPSISFVLKNSVTITKLSWSKTIAGSTSMRGFLFNGKENTAFNERVHNYIEKLDVYFPFLRKLNLIFDSKNTFPHAAGIASSSSGFGALALLLTDLEQILYGRFSTFDFQKKASFMARIGSGSACRSVINGWSSWGEAEGIYGSSHYYAKEINDKIHPFFKNYRDTILILNSGQKAVSSSAGHELMNNHPFAEARIVQANKNSKKLLEALKQGNIPDFCELVENEALTLHSMMMTSNPAYILMVPETLAVIHKIWEIRKNIGLQVCFTLDAGANVHMLYSAKIEKEAKKFIKDELIKYCENGKIIEDEAGEGAVKIME